jgi:hypothetical protein
VSIGLIERFKRLSRARFNRYPTWLTLHAELEIEHFQDTLRVAAYHANDPATIAALMGAIERGIDRHVQYFEDMLVEINSNPA